MKVLLTGGTGYIGSHTAAELLRAGYDVVLADDLSNSNASVLDRLTRLTGKHPAFYRIDVSDKAALAALFDTERIDAVLHFAGNKTVGESVRFPLKYYRNNLDTTLTLLEVMAEHGCRTIVFSSSAAVYGAGASVPFRETEERLGSTNPYGWTKLMNERVLRSTAEADESLSVVLLRYFNPVGADESGLLGEAPNGVPNNLMPCITQTAAGLREHLSVFGGDYPTPDGTPVRDYLHITDVARGHLAALRYGETHTGCEVFNLGAGRGYSVLEVLAVFERATGRKVPYVFAPRRAGDVAVSYADTAKAASVLGWRAECTLEDMCRDAWRWQCVCTAEK